ncbi:FAD-dependent oxidoreductase [Planctomycetota bacterium]
MKSYDVVVIGGSAAGIPAGITARRHYPDKTIALIRKEQKVPIPCGIPYVFGTVMGTDKNIIPDAVLEQNKIDLIIDEATAVDPKAKSVSTASGETVEYEKLVLATGSDPLQPPIKGIDKTNVYFVKKDVPYLDELLSKLDEIKDIVVLGGGFIGVEFADELRKRGLNVSIVEMLPHCLLLAFEENLCAEAEEKLTASGVNVVTDLRLEEILGDDTVSGIKLSDGQELKVDIVLVSIGVVPNIKLAEEAGLEIGKGGIVVDNHMRTSDENIFAVGDCTSKKSFFTGKPSGLNLASIATTEARVAGANLFETRRENSGVIGVFSTIVGDMVLASAGLGEKEAHDNGYDVASGEIEKPNRHPGGMPGMKPMKVKLVFNKANGELLGGHARGGESVGELINTISACIQKKMTADDIAMFQLGTHPAVTASPIAYQLVNAAELAIKAMRE